MGTNNQVIAVVMMLLLAGCTKDQPTTAPLDHITTQEVVVPVATCPKQVNEVAYPARPALAIDRLSASDSGDYKKVGQAYMQTINDLQSYAGQLEDVAYGIKEICNTVNTNNTGK